MKSQAFAKHSCKRFASISAALLTAIATAAGSPVIVHEWGTFTSVAGPNGEPMEWAPLSGPPDLPPFVEHLGMQFSKYVPGFVRMETPVLFFYSPQAVTLNVHVDFPQGWMTEFYPRPTSAQPREVTGEFRNGSIEWSNLRVDPGAQMKLPTSPGESRYYAARNTDAAPLEINGQNEKMLFYRGVGNFRAPIQPRYLADGKLEIQNAGRPIPLAFLFENHEGKIGYRRIGRIEGTVRVDAPEMNASTDRLRQDLINELIEFGLYRKEAVAMLDTWKDSWFEEGSRIIEIEPRAQVDEWLPTRISPQPAEMARVFVGRIELLSPGTRATIKQARANGDEATLKKFGRFLHVFETMMRENPVR